MKEIGVGLLGFGLVGSGVVKILLEKQALIERRSGLKLSLRKIADLDLDSSRGVPVPSELLTKDAEQVVDDPSVGIVVELIGGLKAAGSLTERALKLGKPVVTANKALIAERGAELMKLATKHKADLLFEASVGGGMPLIHALRENMVSEEVRSIYGILNGTCNYILTRMEQDGLSFNAALAEAKAAGFAEADPSLDIDGIDTAHKAVILASMVYGFHVPMRSVHVEGIRELDSNDMFNARNLGYRIKLLAVIKASDEGVEVRVHPTLLRKDSVMASVSGVFNAVLLNGDGVGDVLWYGKGAGRDPTASAVVSDIVDAARWLGSSSERRAPGFALYNPDCKLLDSGEATVRSYMRLTLLDRPGVFGQIASVLGRHGISIASLMQKEERSGEQVPVIVVTHLAKERQFRAALSEIDALPVVGARTVRYKIED